MPAYFVVIPEQLPTDGDTRYRDEVGAVMAPYGARYLARVAGRHEVLEGDFALPLGRVAIVEFPSYEAAKAYYDSPEYAPLKAHRQARGRFTILLVDGVPAEEPPTAQATTPSA